MLKFDKTILLMILLVTFTPFTHYAASAEGQEQPSNLSTRTPISNVTDESRNLFSSDQEFRSSKLTEKNQSSGPNQGFLYLATQIAAGGAIAGLALFGANMLLDEVRKPRLKLEKGCLPEPVTIDLNVYKTNNPQYRSELSTFKVKYRVNRIAIRNKGKNAAKGCKAVLKKDRREEKICWSVPSERYIMTLNAKSLEFVDVCAVIVGDPEKLLNNVLKNVKELEGEVNQLNELSQRFDMFRIRNFVSLYYKSKEDIPRIIAPTENGWQSPYFNRKLEPGPAEVIITAENARPLQVKLELLADTCGNDRILRIVKSQESTSHKIKHRYGKICKAMETKGKRKIEGKS